jgi:hypothetical protein
MIVILVAAVSLLTQACLIRDPDRSKSMEEAALLDHYRAQAEGRGAANRSPDETDRSRIAGTTGER